MIKGIITSVLSAVIAIGVYEKYVLGLDRSERNSESSAVVEGITQEAINLGEYIPNINSEEDVQKALGSVHEKAREFFDTLKNSAHDSRNNSQSGSREMYK